MDENLLQDVVAKARAAGADAAEAVFAERASLSVTVRLGALEEVEREESRDLGLRVFVGQRQATVSGSDISADGRGKLIERAVAMARRWRRKTSTAGLAPADRLAHGPFPDLDLYDAAEPSAETLEARALAAEDAARATPGVTNSDSASAAWSTGAWLASSPAPVFRPAHRASSFSLVAVAIAGDDSEQGAGLRRPPDPLGDRPARTGRAGRRGRAPRRGAAGRAQAGGSRTAPVIFENRLAASTIGPLLGAISGPAIARGVSFLKTKLGEPVFSKAVTISDEPHRVRGLGSQPFDDEGVANHATNIIDEGVLTTWLLNSASARQLGLQTTGHASRGLAGPPGVSTSNLTLQPGEKDQAALMRDAGSGRADHQPLWPVA